MNRAIAVVALVVVSGCGGSQGSVDNAQSPSAPLTPGLKCLDAAKAPRSVAADAPARIDVAHIVVKYAGLRDSEKITRTREEACLRATQARERLLKGGDWDQTFEEYSDTKDATKGVFRTVSQENLEEGFGNMAFSLKVDELSQVVETEKGFHVIWRMK
jgi:hypothetical protein